MNTGLKNRLLILAAAAGLAGYGVACSSDAPAAEEGAAAETAGGEGSCSGEKTEAAPEAGGEEAAPAEGGEAAPAEGGGEAAGGEGSCG